MLDIFSNRIYILIIPQGNSVVFPGGNDVKVIVGGRPFIALGRFLTKQSRYSEQRGLNNLDTYIKVLARPSASGRSSIFCLIFHKVIQ